MDDIDKVIDDLQCVKKLAMLPKYGVSAIETAISAMQELEKYRKLGASPQRCAELISERSAAKRILAHYETIGTLEECREAVKRQREIPPRKAFIFEGKQAEIAAHNSIANFDTYRCPECGRIVAERTVVKSVYPDGFIKYKYCKDCGQKLDWGENDGC